MRSIEDFCIEESKYDLIIAVSALEHIDSERSFISKLSEISNGVRTNGVVCLVINSEVKETDKSTGKEIPAQFEVNMSTEKMQAVLREKFSGFDVIKETVSAQRYDIPREDVISNLETRAVTFVAQKK